MFENEQCWILFGRRFKNFWFGKIIREKETEGQPTQVEFDGEWVLRREEECHDIVGFLHTHPNMSNSPSSTDFRTMDGWRTSFGKPLLCGIDGKNGLAFYDCYEEKGDLIFSKVRYLKIGNYFVGFSARSCEYA